MNAVNETAVRLRVRDFTESSETWGRESGRQVSRRLEDAIFENERAHPIPMVFVLDLSGLPRIDASFPQEAIVELLRRFRGRRYFVLTNLENPTVEENVSLAFEKRGEIALIRDSRGLRTIGQNLSPDLFEILKLADLKSVVTSKDLVDHFDRKISLPNASNKLKLLWEIGLLRRIEGVAKSGGREHMYAAVA